MKSQIAGSLCRSWFGMGFVAGCVLTLAVLGGCAAVEMVNPENLKKAAHGAMAGKEKMKGAMQEVTEEVKEEKKEMKSMMEEATEEPKEEAEEPQEDTAEE